MRKIIVLLTLVSLCLMGCNRTIPPAHVAVGIVGNESDEQEISSVFEGVQTGLPIGNGNAYKAVIPFGEVNFVKSTTEFISENNLSVLVVVNCVPDQVPDIIEMAKKANIAIIFTGSAPDKNQMVTYQNAYFVGSDFKSSGNKIVDAIHNCNPGIFNAQLGKVILFVQGGVNYLPNVRKATVIKDVLKSAGISITDKEMLSVPDMDRLSARAMVHKYLGKNKNTSFIIATDDALTLGAYDAVRQLNSNVKVYSMNTDPDLKAGGNYNTVAGSEYPKLIGNTIAKVSLQIWEQFHKSGSTEQSISNDSRWIIVTRSANAAPNTSGIQ